MTYDMASLEGDKQHLTENYAHGVCITIIFALRRRIYYESLKTTMKRQHDPCLNSSGNTAALYAHYGRSKVKFVEAWISNLPEPMDMLEKYPKTNEKRDSAHKKPLALKSENDFNRMDVVSVLYDMKAENLNPFEISDNAGNLEEPIPNMKYAKSEYSWTSDDCSMEVFDLVEFPPDCVVNGKKFPELSIDSIIKEKTEVKIKISDFIAPMRFWFIIENVEENFRPQFKEMKCFYGALKDDELKMVSTHVFPQQICLVKFVFGYARGIIQSYLMGSNVKVFLVDYGFKVSVSPSSLKYLKNEYLKIPRQALRGTFDNVKQIEPWTSQAKRHFYSLMSRMPFMAKIVKIKKAGDKRVFHLELSNQNSEISIRKLQIDKKLAELK